ncbi:transcription factor 15 [Echinococcus multilocularis]|uniref:Transcription factor 15 n=1 Tax=Echinococcus multilocularis TaxID=6211 RepID=A0A068Y1L1_ECHMU|nr:transcription factor 15 [Echinococcus multilocularis]
MRKEYQCRTNAHIPPPSCQTCQSTRRELIVTIMEFLGTPDTSNPSPQPPLPPPPACTTSSTSLMPPQRGDKTDLRLRIKHVMNAKERTRTASVNDAFLMLRRLIPTQPLNRKLSKIETLRLATSYIAHLNSILVTGIPAAEQPCLRHLNTLCGGQPPRVCTFCVNEFNQRQKKLEEQI